MNTTTVLVIGSGGRESALVYGYGKSKHVDRILAVPGNDHMQDITGAPVFLFPSISVTDREKIIQLCKDRDVTLVDIAPDKAVAAGLGDALKQAGILFVGPTKHAGQIEWDKQWSRKFMEKFGISHPSFDCFSSIQKALAFLRTQPNKPWVIKANGLADGKGVILTRNNEEAQQAVLEMRRFGTAGTTFLLEEYLEGEEFSTFVVSDGVSWKTIGSAQDHKLVFDGDKGPNTGGMGCSTPPLLLTQRIKNYIDTGIITKTIDGMRKIGRPYTGILYLGGIVVKGKPYVIEFNARWGDPEAQVLLPGLVSDLFEMSYAVAKGDMSKAKIRMDTKARVVIAGCAKGYPSDYTAAMGKEIFGLQDARCIKGTHIFGAGIQRKKGKDYVNGGRLFYIVGEGKDVIAARKKAYKAMSLIHIQGDNLHYRTDIGWRDVKRLRKK